MRAANYVSTGMALVGIWVAATGMLMLLWGWPAKSTELSWRIFGTGLVLFAGSAAALCTLRSFHLNNRAVS